MGSEPVHERLYRQAGESVDHSARTPQASADDVSEWVVGPPRRSNGRASGKQPVVCVPKSDWMGLFRS